LAGLDLMDLEVLVSSPDADMLSSSVQEARTVLESIALMVAFEAIIEHF
jgi:hypothetical protein